MLSIIIITTIIITIIITITTVCIHTAYFMTYTYQDTDIPPLKHLIAWSTVGELHLS